MNWLQDIISKFSAQGLAVVGLAYFRDIGKGGVRTVTVTNRDGEVTPVALNEDYNGYIRAVNNANYRLREAIDCTANLYDVEQDVAIVMWVDRKVNPNGVMQAIQQAVAGNDILNTSFDKQVILNEEGLPENDYIMLKVVVRMVSEYAGSSCPADVCAVYYDPCFEVPNRPEPSPPVDPCGCECTVGGECCDYSVEGIDVFANCVEFTINQDLVFNEPEGGFNFFSFQTVQPIFPNYVFLVNPESNPDLGLTPTVEELCDAIEASFDSLGGLYSYQRNGNSFKVCYTGIEAYSVSTIGLEGAYNLQFNPFSYSINSQVAILSNEEYFNLLISFEQNIPDNVFQVLINSEWTDVTDEVIEGTWQRTNVCDDVITEWRIIDSEENVINNGEVTAACDEATEVTDSVCNWLQEHQTAIEQLQNNPSGLTCETLAECEAFVEVKDKADTAVQPDDLATVATTGSYNDLTDQPAIPAAQIQSDWNQTNNAAVDFIKNKPVIPTVPTNVSAFTNDAGYITSAALNPLAFFSGSAGHTGDTNETIVQTIAIPSTAWATNAVYQILARVTRLAGVVTFRVRLNTTPDLTGTPVTILEFATSAGSYNPNRLLIKTGNSFEYSTLTTISDLTGASTTATATVSTASTTYIMLTIQSTTGAGNGNFIMLNIARQ